MQECQLTKDWDLIGTAIIVAVTQRLSVIVTKLIYTLTQQYWWEGMFSDVVKWCCSCLICTAYQSFGHRKTSLLKTISVGFPFEREGVDILDIYANNFME